MTIDEYKQELKFEREEVERIKKEIDSLSQKLIVCRDNYFNKEKSLSDDFIKTNSKFKKGQQVKWNDHPKAVYTVYDIRICSYTYQKFCDPKLEYLILNSKNNVVSCRYGTDMWIGENELKAVN